MLRAAVAAVRGRVATSSLIHLSVGPPPQSKLGAIPARSWAFDARGRFGIGVLRYKTECSSTPAGVSSSAGESHTYSAVQVEDILKTIDGQVQDILKTIDGRLLKVELYAAKHLQNLVKMEQVIKSLDEKISREMKTKAVAANEILENQQNQERLLRSMKTEIRKNLLSALGEINKICNIIFLVGLAAAYLWRYYL